MTLKKEAGDRRLRRSRIIASYSMITALVAVTLALTLRAMETNASPISSDQTEWTGESTSVRSPANQVPSVSSLIGGLEERLAEDPNDGRGWLLLAKSYQHLGRHEDARRAFAHAAALGETDDSSQRSPATMTPQAAMDIWGSR